MAYTARHGAIAISWSLGLLRAMPAVNRECVWVQGGLRPARHKDNEHRTDRRKPKPSSMRVIVRSGACLIFRIDHRVVCCEF